MICVPKQLQMNLVWVVSGQIKAAWEVITFSFNISLREYRFDPDKINWQDTQTPPSEVSVIVPVRQMQGEFAVGLGGDNNQCDGIDPFLSFADQCRAPQGWEFPAVKPAAQGDTSCANYLPLLVVHELLLL